MKLVIDANGTVTCLYTEVVDLRRLGKQQLKRASQVEPDSEGNWWATRIGSGVQLGPFKKRSEALAAEAAWLESRM